jgi:hypothetical protein
MLNIAPKLKTKKTEVVSCLPSGLDVEFEVSYHDNMGNKFDAVQSRVMIESNAKVSGGESTCEDRESECNSVVLCCLGLSTPTQR